MPPCRTTSSKSTERVGRFPNVRWRFRYFEERPHIAKLVSLITEVFGKKTDSPPGGNKSNLFGLIIIDIILGITNRSS